MRPRGVRIGCKRSSTTDTACTPASTGRRAQLMTRTGLDWTLKYPTIAAAVSALPARQAYLDGELCGVRPDGKTSFSLIQDGLGCGQRRRPGLLSVRPRRVRSQINFCRREEVPCGDCHGRITNGARWRCFTSAISSSIAFRSSIARCSSLSKFALGGRWRNNTASASPIRPSCLP
jgi:hypothetical protein